MKNNKLQEKLKSSLVEETNSLESRFANAEKIFNKEIEAPEPSSKIRPKAISKSYTLLQSELDSINNLIIKLAQHGVIIKESEIIRMALCAFLEQSDKLGYLDKIYRFRQ